MMKWHQSISKLCLTTVKSWQVCLVIAWQEATCQPHTAMQAWWNLGFADVSHPRNEYSNLNSSRSICVHWSMNTAFMNCFCKFFRTRLFDEMNSKCWRSHVLCVPHLGWTFTEICVSMDVLNTATVWHWHSWAMYTCEKYFLIRITHINTVWGKCSWRPPAQNDEDRVSHFRWLASTISLLFLFKKTVFFFFFFFFFFFYFYCFYSPCLQRFL